MTYLVLAFGFAFGLLPNTSTAEPLSKSRKIAVRSTITVGNEFLSTPWLWANAPRLSNPHRVRWAVRHSLELIGARAVPIGNEFGIQFNALYSVSEMLYRREPHWYSQGYTDFPCGSGTPVPEFATEAGTLVAAKAASEEWLKVLERNLSKLGNGFSLLRSKDPSKMVAEAAKYLAWQKESLIAEWERHAMSVALKKEWEFYREDVKKKQYCLIAGVKSAPRFSWKTIVDPPSSTIPERFLIRLPARQWSGEYVVRLSIHENEKGEKTRFAYFVIDPSAPENLLDPESWLAPQVKSKANTLNLKMEGWEWAGKFSIQNSNRFKTPEHFSKCCDGVLGRPFMMGYAVEFLPAQDEEGAAVVLWERSEFSSVKYPNWVEVDQDLNSNCELRKNLSETTPLRIQFLVSKGQEPIGPTNPAHGVFCGNDRIFSAPQGLHDAVMAYDLNRWGATAFAMDLPNGRLWLGALEKTGTSSSQEVLSPKLKVTEVAGKRQVLLMSSAPESGFVIGSRILGINRREADELDLWEIQQYLSGKKAPRVSVMVLHQGDEHDVSLDFTSK